jgi:hypothetical protein
MLTVLGAMSSAFATACPGPDVTFRSFLARCTDDSEFQRDRVVDPLIYRTGNPHDQTNNVELWDIEKVRALKQPLVMQKKTQRRHGINQSIPFATSLYAQAYYDKPEADSYRLLLTFRRIDGCWYLEQLYDLSL